MGCEGWARDGDRHQQRLGVEVMRLEQPQRAEEAEER